MGAIDVVMRLAVAGLSSRMMTEAVVREGGSAIALDLFGDIDTRRAATRWQSIGRPETMQVDGDALLDALRDIARLGEADGWVAGSGFEGCPDLLERGAALLPLIGTSPGSMRRLRDPRTFFDTLTTLGIAHPETRFNPPSSLDGWLLKDGGGAGGWQVVDAAQAGAASTSPASYWQRQVDGTPMSATFVADGRTARVFGFNRLLTRCVGARPHVFRGVVGPSTLDARVARDVASHVGRLTQAFGLRGLCSLDFLLDGTRALVLEINARPPASMCLYPARRTMHAHVRAALRGHLPTTPVIPATSVARRVRGFEIVFAPHAFMLADHHAAALSSRGDCHDLPVVGSTFRPGDPVCSVTADAADAAHVVERLARAVERVSSVLLSDRSTARSGLITTPLEAVA